MPLIVPLLPSLKMLRDRDRDLASKGHRRTLDLHFQPDYHQLRKDDEELLIIISSIIQVL